MNKRDEVRSWEGYWSQGAPKKAILSWPSLGKWLGKLRRPAILLPCLFLPSILAGVYFLFVAADQYESEARFVVRSAAKPDISGGLAFLTQLGFARSQDDSFIVQSYMASRDAVEQLRARLPLLEMYGRRDADFVARYPSFLFGSTEEEFYRYLQYAISIVHTDRTGISVLKVRAFQAEDAQKVAEVLLSLGEDLVNRINGRMQKDAVGNSQAQLQAAQQRLVEAQAALTDFRNRELVVDPTQNAVALADLISRLSSELGATRAQIIEMTSGSSASPQLAGLKRKATALEEQVARERSRIANDTEGLATRIAAYERLSLEREFANRMVSAAEDELVRARAEAARQLLYLERVVEPNRPDYSTEPKRFRGFFTVFVGNFMLVLIGWLIVSGVREHVSHE